MGGKDYFKRKGVRTMEKIFRRLSSVATLSTIALAVVLGVVAMFTISVEATPETLDSHEIISDQLSVATGEQQKALLDFVVNSDEYQAAMIRTVACAFDQGVKVEIEPASGKALPKFIMTAASLSDTEAMETALNACKQTHFNSLHAAYIASLSPTNAERAGAREFLTTCMARSGAPASTRIATDEQVEQWGKSKEPWVRNAFYPCGASQNQEFGFWP
jgi:hypothetical protein